MKDENSFTSESSAFKVLSKAWLYYQQNVLEIVHRIEKVCRIALFYILCFLYIINMNAAF